MSSNESLLDKLNQLIQDLRNLRKKIMEAASVDLMLAALRGVLTNFEPKIADWHFVPHLDKTRILPKTPLQEPPLGFVHRRPTHYLGDENLGVLREFPTLSRPDVQAIKTILQTYTEQSQRRYIARHRNLTGTICVDGDCYAIELVYMGYKTDEVTFTREQVVFILDDVNYPATFPLVVRVRGSLYSYDDGLHRVNMLLGDEIAYYSSAADVWVKSSGLYVVTSCTESFDFAYARSMFYCTPGYSWVFVETPEWSMRARIPA